MQQTGTLKKRRRRNLSKVNGHSTIPYDETVDTFTGRYLLLDEGHWDGEGLPTGKRIIRAPLDRPKLLANEDVGNYRRLSSISSRSRPTRDPSFHNPAGPDVESGLRAASRKRTSKCHNRVDKIIDKRSRFLSETAIKRLKQLICLGTCVGSFPWKWNGKEYRIERWKPSKEKWWWLQWLLVTIQTFILFCFQVYVFIQGFTTSETRSNRSIFMSCFGILWYVYALGYNLNWYLYKEMTRKYINNMLRFNHKHVAEYVISLDDYEDRGGSVINLCFFSNLSQIIISVSFFLRMPFMPWYLFSYIYPKPWYWLIPGTIHDIMLVGQVIASYLFTAWIIVAHSNTLQFWLREIHNNNDSDCTSDQLRSPKNAISTYKALQVLNIQFNECMASMAIPWMKFVVASAIIPCGYVLIRRMNGLFIDELPGILTYPMSILDCGLVGFVVLNMIAEVFDLGCGFIHSWNQTKQKDFRRILMSCPALKIWNARMYFITVTTVITYFKVVFEIITNCIIVFP